MIVRGGVVFINESDQLPQVTIIGSKVYMEVPESATYKEMCSFIAERVGPDSLVDGCTFISSSKWAKSQALELLMKSKD